MGKKYIGTKGSHAVWARYLREFAKQGNTIYVKNKRTGRCFSTSIDNIGKVNHIYTLEDRITKKDIEVSKQLFQITDLSEEDEIFIHQLVCFLNDEIYFEFNRKEPRFQLMDRLMNESILSRGIHNFQRNQEKLFTFYENNFLQLYERLLLGDASFYNNLLQDIQKMELGFRAARSLKTVNLFHSHCFYLMRVLIGDKKFSDMLKIEVKLRQKKLAEALEKKFVFSKEEYFASYYLLTFILTQLFRTEKSMDSFEVAGKTIKNNFPDSFDNIKSFSIMALHYQTYNIALKMINDMYKIIILNNTTNIPFIACDCPVANTFSRIVKNRPLKKHELELYYPLSPDKAMLLSGKNEYIGVDIIFLLEDEVVEYNRLIENSSYRYMFSSMPFG